MFDKDDVIVPKQLRPKDAATLILVRRAREGVRVLMGQRHGNMAFMAGKYVFPGGRMDPCDLRLLSGSVLRTSEATKLGPKGRGLALAAIRETFEETGILVGRQQADTPRTRAQSWARFFAHGVVPDLSQLTFIGRAITPPNRTRRFDARFFMADASAIARERARESDELLTPCWVTLAEARALDLPSITRRMLDEVEARASGEVDRPIPFFRFRNGKALVESL
ncbi:MAG: NUDIX domain-containing protein [Alphaproteobacteria bacterium]|nr:NUDIX domain-containing protein [Alphaproteobacteria bacterium]